MADATVILTPAGLNIKAEGVTVNIRPRVSFTRGFTTGFPVPVDISLPLDPVSVSINTIAPVVKTGVTIIPDPVPIIINIPGLGSQTIHANVLSVTITTIPLEAIGIGTTIDYEVIVYVTEEVAGNKFIVSSILDRQYIKESVIKEKFMSEELNSDKIIVEEISEDRIIVEEIVEDLHIKEEKDEEKFL